MDLWIALLYQHLPSKWREQATSGANSFHRASWLQYLQLWDLGRFLVTIHTTWIRQRGSWSCFLHWNVFKTMHPRTVCALLLHPTLLIPTLFYRNQKCGCPSEVHPYHVDPCRTRASRGRNEHCFHTPHLSPPGGALPVSSGSSWSSDVGRILPGEEHDFLCDIYDSLFSVLDLHGFSDIFRYDPILMVFMLGFLHQTVHRWQQHDSHAISSATRVLWTLHYTTFRIMVEIDLL